jgi:hypothetical protein
MGFFEKAKKGVMGAYEDVKGNETVKGVTTFLKDRSSHIAHEMMETPQQERREHLARPRRRTSGRLPRKSQPAGYDGSYDMYGTERRGRATGLPQGTLTGLPMDDDMFGVGGFGREAPERREAPPPRRRKQKSKRARTFREAEEPDMMSPGHIPKYLRHMF